MSTIFRSNGRPVDDLSKTYIDAVCDVCGKQADACWIGERQISICYWCAVDKLPALIADAMRARGRSSKNLFETRDRIKHSFMEAAAVAFAHDPEPSSLSFFKDHQLLELIEFEQDLRDPE